MGSEIETGRCFRGAVEKLEAWRQEGKPKATGRSLGRRKPAGSGPCRARRKGGRRAREAAEGRAERTQRGGEEAGRRPPGRRRDPSWETDQRQKSSVGFF